MEEFLAFIFVGLAHSVSEIIQLIKKYPFTSLGIVLAIMFSVLLGVKYYTSPISENKLAEYQLIEKKSKELDLPMTQSTIKLVIMDEKISNAEYNKVKEIYEEELSRIRLTDK